MMKLLISLALVAMVSAYGDCPTCASAVPAATTNCAYEAATSCGCNNAACNANSFRINDCSLNACGDRRLAETTDLEEAAPATAQWGRRRRRFFDARRRRRRFFDARRRRRRTNYPTPFPTPYPTPSPTGVLGHGNCAKTRCVYSNGQTEIFTTTPYENFHCEKLGNGCKCACHKTLKCALRHHHTSGYKKTFEHC